MTDDKNSKVMLWMDAVKQATEEVSQTTLGIGLGPAHELPDLLPWHETIGAYVPWVSEADSVQIGLVSTPSGCFSLARQLLGYSETDALGEEEMADAIREIVNIIGGMSKTIVGGNVSASNMGLPVFIHGYILLTKQQTCVSERVKLGNANCYVFVLHGK